MIPQDPADRLLAAWDGAASLDPAAFPIADLDTALAVQARIVARREARGERRLGHKIGFTNRSLWPLYGVHHPIWGPVWHTTVTWLDRPEARLSVGRWAEPRLEPEIVLGLARSPRTTDIDHVHDCLDWVAHGVEIVTSPWPAWRFSAAQALAAQGLHGALLIGPRVPVADIGGPAALAALRLHLSRDGQAVASGEGRAVLDGPVQALSHLVAELARRGESLPAGSVITTGTLTDAQVLAPGQTWRTRLEGVPLAGLTIHTDP